MNLLLKTKIKIPEFNDENISLIKVENKLNKGLKYLLTFIESPTGFGKTTVLSNWIHKHNLNFCWLTLDEDNDNFLSFWIYFIFSIQDKYKDFFKDILPLFQTSNKPEEKFLINLIINEICSYEVDIYLVIDNFQILKSESIFQSLSYFLERVSSNFHLFINSNIRYYGLNNFSLLRAKRYLIEISSDDFRVSVSELEYLLSLKNISIETKLVHLINEYFEGWLLGIQLFLLSLNDNYSKENIENSLYKNKFVMDFLLEEVFKRLPENIKEFLLRTSIVKEFNFELAKVLVKKDLDKSIIENITKSNIFLNSIGDGWYRYHSTFLVFIKDKAQLEFNKDYKQLNLLASKWFDKNGCINESIYHAFEAREFNFAAHQIEKVVVEMDSKGEVTKLSNWFDLLPLELILTNKMLFFYRCCTYIQIGELNKAFEISNKLRSILPLDNSSINNILEAQILNIDAIKAFYLQEIEKIKELTSKAISLADNDYVLLATCYYNQGVAYFTSDEFDKSLKSFDNAIYNNEKSNNYFNTLNSMIWKANILLMLGKLEESKKIFNIVIIKARELNLTLHPKISKVWGYLSIIHYINNDINKFYETLEQFLSGNTENVECQFLKTLIAYFLLNLKENNKAISIIDSLEINHRDNKNNQTLILVSLINIIKYIQNIDKSDKNIDISIINSNKITYNINTLTIIVLYINYYLYIKDYQRVESIVSNLIDKLNSTKVIMFINYLYLFKIENCFYQKDFKNLELYFEKLISMNDKEEITGLFLSLKPDLLNIFVQLLDSKKTNFRKDLSNKIKLLPLYRPINNNLLSERELEILKLLNEELSFSDISNKVYISINTVKTHIKNIYRKLEVNNKTSALIEAKNKGII
ncbi:MAG: LuxR C-terminal-related transcriptional regulator [Candidatus Sericytochromatia bacterium]